MTPKKKTLVQKSLVLSSTNKKVVAKPTKKLKAKVKKGFALNVRSRHPSHNALKKLNLRLPFRSVVRFGSDWAGDGKGRAECNSVEAVKTSANKLLMKQAFERGKVKTSDWYTTNGETMIFKGSQPTTMNLVDMPWPLVAKQLYGSRGEGNTLLKDQAHFNQWKQGKTLSQYIFEKFYDYNREYRLHVTKDGCFYSCRKMLKQDTPKKDRWFRNDSNSIWITQFDEYNHLKNDFDQPINWNAIVAESVKALTSVGLDVGAIDVRVQSAKDGKGNIRPNPDFIILETNSAPSFGNITLEKYKEVIPTILQQKRRVAAIID